MRSEGFTVSFANGREMRFGGEDEESPDFELEFDSQDSVVTDLDGDDEPESYPCTNLSVVLTFPLDVIFEVRPLISSMELGVKIRLDFCTSRPRGSPDTFPFQQGFTLHYDEP